MAKHCSRLCILAQSVQDMSAFCSRFRSRQAENLGRGGGICLHNLRKSCISATSLGPLPMDLCKRVGRLKFHSYQLHLRTVLRDQALESQFNLPALPVSDTGFPRGTEVSGRPCLMT